MSLETTLADGKYDFRKLGVCREEFLAIYYLDHVTLNLFVII